MQRIQSLSKERPIIEATLEGKKANFLLDTGATVGILSDRIVKKYNIKLGRDYKQPLVGAGGEFKAKYCHSYALLGNKPITQFLVSNIDEVVKSIKAQTGVEIQGIISYPQMQFISITLDPNSNSITV